MKECIGILNTHTTPRQSPPRPLNHARAQETKTELRRASESQKLRVICFTIKAFVCCVFFKGDLRFNRNYYHCDIFSKTK